MWVNADIGPIWIIPKHYIEQFHPKYNSAYTDFEEFDQKRLFRNNPDCPTLTSWMPTQYEASVNRTWERNPYYYAVDTEGNQLPYIDGIDETFITDNEVQKLTIMQGGIDYVHFHGATLADISTLKENEDKGGYEVRLWDSGSGTGMMYFWNYDHPDDKKRELYRTPKFKQAMSFALDRPTIQRIVSYNTGLLTTGTMSPKAIEFNFNEEAQAMYEKARSCYAEYNPTKAKEMLDELGVKDADGDGLREYPDGTKLEVRIDLPADAGKECLDVLEIANQNWKDIGLNVVINQMPPSEFGPMWRGGQGDIHTNWEVGDGPDHLLYPSWVVPNEQERWAPLCGGRLMVIGTPQEDSELDKSPWDRTPPRWASTEAGLRDGPVWELQELYGKAMIEVDDLTRHHYVWDMINIHIDQGPFYIGSVANYPRIIFVSKKLMNVPTKEQLRLGGFVNPWIIPYPAVVNPETYSYKA
jgi:peptide/nickel transport system substrate-binding protein